MLTGRSFGTSTNECTFPGGGRIHLFGIRGDKKSLNGFISPLLLVLSCISIIPSSLYFPYFSLRGLNANAHWTVVAQATPTEWTSTGWVRNQQRPSSSVSMDRGCLPSAGVPCCTLRASLYSSPPPSLRSPPPLWGPPFTPPPFSKWSGRYSAAIVHHVLCGKFSSFTIVIQIGLSAISCVEMCFKIPNWNECKMPVKCWVPIRNSVRVHPKPNPNPDLNLNPSPNDNVASKI